MILVLTWVQLSHPTPAMTDFKHLEQLEDSFDAWRTDERGSSSTITSPTSISSRATTCLPTVSSHLTSTLLLANLFLPGVNNFSSGTLVSGRTDLFLKDSFAGKLFNSFLWTFASNPLLPSSSLKHWNLFLVMISNCWPTSLVDGIDPRVQVNKISISHTASLFE